METNRREFLKSIGLAAVCTCTGMAGFNSCSMIRGVSDTPQISADALTYRNSTLYIDLEKSVFLKTAGRAGKLTIEGEDPIKLIVVHQQAGQFKVFSDRCTHGGRELNYLHDKEQLQCSSFGHSAFKLSNGQVIKGPAEGPLAVYPVTKKGNILEIMIS